MDRKLTNPDSQGPQPLRPGAEPTKLPLSLEPKAVMAAIEAVRFSGPATISGPGAQGGRGGWEGGREVGGRWDIAALKTCTPFVTMWCKIYGIWGRSLK